ncbi:YDG domain-containing protein [Lysobacter humi (ex Lee et al. 2017)]
MTSSNAHRGLRVGILFAAMAQVLWPAQAGAQVVGPGGTTPFGTINNTVSNGAPPTVSTTPSSTTLTVGSNRTIVNWNSFSIGVGQTYNVVFANPQNLVVNRVLGGTTQINGNVASYLGAVGGPTGGHVWVLNPNGVFVGATGRFDVGGMLLTTSGLADADILDGNANFFFSGTATMPVSVASGAQLLARNGSVTLLGNNVSVNGGVLDAGAGDVSLLGIPSVQVTFDASLQQMQQVAVVQGSTVSAGVTVSGTSLFNARRSVLASSGRGDGLGNVLLGGSGANSITFQNGDVVLLAGAATDFSGGYTAIDGANTSTGSFGGLGGSVTLNGRVTAPGSLQVLGAKGIGTGAGALDLRSGTSMRVISDGGIGVSASSVDLRSGGALELFASSIGNGAGDLNLQSGGALSISGNAFGRDIALQSNGALSAYDLTARDDIVIRSSGNVTTQAITAGTTVSGLGATDVTGAGDTLAGGTLTGNDVDLIAGTTGLASIASVTPGAGGDYRISAGDFTGGGALTPTLSGLGSFSITDTQGAFTLGFLVNTPGNFSLRTVNGDITVLSNIASTSGNVVLQAGGSGAVNVNAAVTTGTSAGRSITLDGAGGVVQGPASTLTTNTLNASALGGGLLLDGSNAFSVASLTAAGSIIARSTVAGVAFTSATSNGGSVMLTAQNGMRLSGATLLANNGSVTLNGPVGLTGVNTVTGNNGSVTFNSAVDSTGSSGAGTLVVNSATGTTFASDVGSGYALGAFTVNGASAFGGGTVRTTGGIDLDAVGVTGAGPFTFNADGAFSAGAITAPGSTLTINANGIQATTVSAGNLAGGVFRNVFLNAGTGGIQFAGGSAGSYTVNGAGALNVTGVLETVRLSGNMGGAATLVANNRINSIGPFTSNGLQMRAVDGVVIDGVVNAGGGDVRIESTAPGSSINIASTGEVRGRDVALSSDVFANQSGADAVVASGHWTIYQNATTPGGVYDGLNSNAHAIWGQTINTLAPSSITGNRYVFAYRPTLSFTTLDTTKTYGTVLGGTPSSHYTISGYMPGVAGAYLADTAANVFSGAPTVTSGGFAERATVAGGPYAIDIANGSLSSLSGYQFAFNGTGRVTVDPKAVTGTPTVTTKTYDGNTNATGSIALAGVVSGDVVNAGGTFTFVTKNAGTGKTVNLTGATLTGADAGNYTLSVPATTIGDILQKAITGTPTTATKTYDGTTNGSGTITLSGVVGGDTVGAGGTFTFVDKNAGTGKQVTLSGVTLSGADAGNYTLTVPSSLLGDILQKAISGTVTVNTKTYDGTTGGTGTVTLGGVVAGDVVNGAATFTFADKNAGAGKTVTVSGATLSGADAGNYTVTLPASALGDILRKALTGTPTVTAKTYDGSTAGTGSIALTGVVAGDTVAAGGTFTYADKNAGTGKTVTVSSAALSGADAGNYTLTMPTSALGDILQKAINGTVAVDTKTYDGTTAATGTITLAGVVAGDTIGAGGTFTFADRNAGAGKTVSVGGIALTGADAGNYVVSVPSTAVGEILRRALTGTVTVNTKTYDGNTAATGGITLAGVIAGDSVGATAALTFADKNTGTGKAVNVGGVALTGTDAGNYTLAAPGTATGTITPKGITGTATVGTKTYDGTTAGTGSIALTGVVAGDTVGAGGSFTFADKNAGAGKQVTISGVTLNGVDAGNYTLSVPGSAIGEILRRSITGTATVGAKTYDGTTAGTGSIALNGVVAGDAVGATGTYTFSDANAGTGKTVTVGGVALSGADAGNYTVVVPGTTVADILRRAITVTANPATKQQGAVDPALGYGLTQGSLVTGDSLAGALARAPGEAPGSYAIGQGTLSASANYQLTFVGSTLTITAAPVDPVDPIAGIGVSDDLGRLVRYLDGGGEPTVSRARDALEIVDERSPCDPADREARGCETGRPD